METRMDEALSQTNLSMLAGRCSDELKRRRRREPADDRYCLEIFYRAIVEHADQAWSMVQQCFSEHVRIWMRSHPSNDIARLHDTEENYIAQTFSRFWFATRDHMDTVRVHFRSAEVSLPDPGFPDEPVAEETADSQMLWESIQSLLPDEYERRVAYLLYFCGFKPREIVSRFPKEFADVKDVYRLNQNIIDRLRRNRDRLRWLLGGEEI